MDAYLTSRRVSTGIYRKVLCWRSAVCRLLSLSHSPHSLSLSLHILSLSPQYLIDSPGTAFATASTAAPPCCCCRNRVEHHAVAHVPLHCRCRALLPPRLNPPSHLLSLTKPSVTSSALCCPSSPAHWNQHGYYRRRSRCRRVQRC
jgi:hypothetical protein